MSTVIHLNESVDSSLCNRLSIFHQNMCGLNNKKDVLEIYLDSLCSPSNYLCISEHFLNEELVSLLNLSKYNVASYNTRVNKLRGGTIILAETDREYEDLPIAKKLHNMNSFEICCVKDVSTGLSVCCCYRTPYDKNLDTFMVRLERLLEHFFNKNCVICGDFNIDLSTDNKKRNDLLNLLTCYNFRPLISSTTFIRNDSRSCIDNVFTNLSDDHVISCDVDHNGLADGHAGLLCSTVFKNNELCRNIKTNSVQITKRIFNAHTRINFRNLLLNHDWSDFGINSTIRRNVHTLF